MFWCVRNAAPRARGRTLKELVWMGSMLPKRQRRIHGTRAGLPSYEVSPVKQPKTVSFADVVEAQEQDVVLAPITTGPKGAPAPKALKSGNPNSRGIPETPVPKPEVASRGLPEAPPEIQDAPLEPLYGKGVNGKALRQLPTCYPTRSCLTTGSPRIRPDGAGRLAWDCPHEGRIQFREYIRCMREMPRAEHSVRSDAWEVEDARNGHDGPNPPAYTYCLRANGQDAKYTDPIRGGLTLAAGISLMAGWQVTTITTPRCQKQRGCLLSCGLSPRPKHWPKRWGLLVATAGPY